MSNDKQLDCPSAPHQHPDARLFGVVLEEEGRRGSHISTKTPSLPKTSILKRSMWTPVMRCALQRLAPTKVAGNGAKAAAGWAKRSSIS